MNIVKVERIHPDAKMPARQHRNDAGWDVAVVEGGVLAPGETAAFPTGLVLDIERGWEVQVRSRSGLSLKQGVIVLNAPGTIDSGYTGEVKMILHNTSRYPRQILPGDRVGQFVVARVEDAVFAETDETPAPTERGDRGYGSTGR